MLRGKGDRKCLIPVSQGSFRTLSKNLLLCHGILATLVAAFAYAPQTSARPQIADECPSQHQIADEFLRRINAIRTEPRRCGAIHYAAAPKLTWKEVLFQAAQQHVADMGRRNYFSHNTPEGLTPGKRADIAGYKWSYYGENIGLGQTSVKDVLNAWLRSPTHCQAMMEKEFRDVALGCAAANGELRWALELGLPQSSRLPAQ